MPSQGECASEDVRRVIVNKNRMRYWVVVWTACACLAAGTARAQYYYGGVELSWNDCGSSGAKDKSSVCTTDTTALKLYGSFVAPPGLVGVTGYRIRVGALDVGNVPWWDYSTGGCREGLWSLRANAPGPGCSPIAFTLASNPTFVGYPNGGVTFGATAEFLEPTAIPEGETFYAFTLTLRQPAPSDCDGCCIPSCLLATLEFYQESGIVTMEGDFTGAATWQGGVCGVHQGSSAIQAGCIPTPTRSSTWGSLKVLYR
jgi:hypothetical protein